MSYPYSQADLLKTPHSYMYTPFEGPVFLLAYLASRGQVIDCLRMSLDTGRATAASHEAQLGDRYLARAIDRQGNAWLPDAIDKSFTSSPKQAPGTPDMSLTGDAATGSPVPAASTSPVAVDWLLRALLQAYVPEHGVPGPEGRIWINRLIGRFEVTKKIHAVYREGGRHGEGPFDDLRLYAQLAMLLAMRYMDTGNLRFMSTLLKINDTLCSQKRRLADTPPAIVPAFSGLLLERAGICRLMEAPP